MKRRVHLGCEVAVARAFTGFGPGVALGSGTVAD